MSDPVLLPLSLTLSIITCIVFGIFAVLPASDSTQVTELTGEEFVTARKSLNQWTIAWSFYANAVGCGTLFFPPMFATLPGNGYIGLIANSLANAFPVLFVAYFGNQIRQRFSESWSLSDYTLRRFGRTVNIFVFALVFFNMALALIAEYSAVSSLYTSVLGADPYSIVFIVGIITMIYTYIGGLYVSLCTDQWQSITGTALLVILIIYVAISFRNPLPIPAPDVIQPTSDGWAQLFVMPAAVFTGTIFSEATWQRAWAARDDKALRSGANIAFVIIFVVISLFALGGLLVAWAGMDIPNPNSVLFQLVGPGSAPTWVTVVVVVMATVMNECAVDSIQNGLAASITTTFFKNSKSSTWSRVLIVLTNIPCMVLGTQGYSLSVLFGISNLITIQATLPILLGAIDDNAKYITGANVLFSSLFSFVSVAVYATIAQSGDFVGGMTNIYVNNPYIWQPYLVAIVSSLVGMVIWYAIEHLYRAVFRKGHKSSSGTTIVPNDS
ncbi:uncharacterized protein BJ171DRAFT_460502 [Polychytrium aggregatum]|uniref:uncharacterized protein n=1 Tax=Polychytrium aggregatum TaxID=110093 RepID=UPI0022FE0002|nr:uncharacterized protein BJ171DRAFT_460502 [Polychytrium aggregatum]KAI9203347.1 hypothetical protein BJ171DRAFT_460502 [Polychytrium aggregatum]